MRQFWRDDVKQTVETLTIAAAVVARRAAVEASAAPAAPARRTAVETATSSASSTPTSGGFGLHLLPAMWWDVCHDALVFLS